MKHEGLDQKEASGKCFGIWKEHQKNKKSKAANIVDSLAEELLKNEKVKAPSSLVDQIDDSPLNDSKERND